MITEEHISLIINGFFTLIGVVIGAFVDHILNIRGSIKLFINYFDILYLSQNIDHGLYFNKRVPFENANKIMIHFDVDITNTSRSTKSMRDIKLLNSNGQTSVIDDLSITNNFGVRIKVKKITILNLMPNETIQISCEVTTDKTFIIQEKMKLYLQFNKGKSKRKYKLLLNDN